MANIHDPGRQAIKVATQKFDYTDLGNGVVATLRAKLPSNAVILGGGVMVDTAWNSTTNTVGVGDTASNTRFAATLDLKTTGFKPLTTLGRLGTGLKEVTLLGAYTGGAPTAGVGYLVVNYVEIGRADEVME